MITQTDTLLSNQEFAQIYHAEMNNLKQICKKHNKDPKNPLNQIPVDGDHFSLFIEWAKDFHKFYEEELHLSRANLNTSLEQETYHLPSNCLKTFIPNFLNSIWPIRFTNKFLKKLETLKEEASQISLLSLMKNYAQGFLGRFSIVPFQGLPYMVFCNLKFLSQILSLLCASTSNNILNLINLRRFIDIVSGKEKGNIQNVCSSFLDEYKKNPVRKVRPSKHPEDFLEKLNPKTRKTKIKNNNFIYCFEETSSDKEGIVPLSPLLRSKQSEEHHDDVFLPSCFETNYLTPEEIEEFDFDWSILRWVPRSKNSSALKKEENIILSKINSKILSEIADFDSSAELVKLLEKIESMKIKLTTEEKNLIGQNGNVLAIGRSGTGKTTCCVLRLFSQEMLFKIRVSQAQGKNGILMNTRASANKFGELTGIHSVFITASPILANEVQRYYDHLNLRVNEEIKEKQSKRKGPEKFLEQKSESPFVIEDEKSCKSKMTFENMDFEPQIGVEKNETVLIIKNEDEELLDEEDFLIDEEEEQALNKLNKQYSLDNIEDKEFPLFLTVKKIISMIDGTLRKPFFLRRQDKSIIGSSINAQWHNETKGMMMINDKYKNKFGDETDDQMENTVLIKNKSSLNEENKGEDNLDSIKIDESNLYAEYERYQAILEKKREQAGLEDEQNKRNKMNFEIDYDYFYNHFWQGHLSNTERSGNVSCIRLWNEIISSIKGSSKSHLYPGFCLPQEIYCSEQFEGISLLDVNIRTEIYNLFVSYEKWKHKEGGYDFMDVVNHILNEIKFEGYQGVPIHFTLIDEVQDLSHATILLLMMITEQSVFFAGDTAQTIAKGVGVRFANLSTLFKMEPEGDLIWKTPTVHQLTVNFRSHSKILDMANSVVTLLETFFPRTIDKLRKEKSEVDGPKPILLEDVDIEVLFTILFGSENNKAQNQGGNCGKPPIEFGCNQVVIVRDQESKKNLPQLLKHALCLTVYEAKGLEFDDVVLYNFFAESPIPQKLWKVMNFLEIEEQELDKDTFEKFYFTSREEGLVNLKGEANDRTRKNSDKKSDSFDFQAPNIFNMNIDLKNNKYKIKKVSLPKKHSSNLEFETYGILCTELKQLYVALTRPRNRLIIYDDKIENREKVEKYWKDLSLVEVTNKKLLEQQKKGSTEGKHSVKDNFTESFLSDLGNKFTSRINK